MAAPIIEVHGLAKDFLLPHMRQSTLKGHLIHHFRRKQMMEVQHALRDISFEVDRGEFLGVIGRNGSGKSTLLKILAGIYRPTLGSVDIRGTLVPFIELGVGFNPELTGRENVYLNGALLGFSRDEVDEIYGDIVAFAELEDFMDQRLKNYSSGMQVRIAFSVATRARADILLIDEVLAVGDADFQRKCFDHFRALRKTDTTIVFVTHDMVAVREFCDRAILIEGSRILAEGDPEEVSMQYLRLFNATPHTAQGDVPQDEVTERRWGEGHVRYSRVTTPDVLEEGTDLVIQLEAIAEEDLDEVVFAMIIKDSVGTTLMGADSRQRGVTSGPVAKGQTVRATWTVPNVFSNGRHTVSAILRDRHGLRVYDFWDESAEFTAVKRAQDPWIISPDVWFALDGGQNTAPEDPLPSVPGSDESASVHSH